MKFKLFLLSALLSGSIARADNLYLSELSGPDILKFDPSGASTVFASAGLSAPNGLTFDNSGALYVANFGDNTIERYDSSGEPSLYSGTGLNQPTVLAFDPSHNLYVANRGGDNGYIEKIDSTGNASVFATGLYQPQGIVCDNNGNVYVSTWINNVTALAILKFTPGGQRSTFVLWNQPGTHFGLPRGLAFFNNNIYCTDGSSLSRISLAGAVTVLSTTGLTNGIGVAVDSQGNSYVSDQLAGRVMKYDPSGHGSVFASGFDGNGILYVAVEPVPEPTVLALAGLGAGVFAFRRMRK